MKKKIFILGVFVTSSTALFAKQIDFDTPVKWNSDVIASALTNSGFVDSGSANWDVKVTRQRILADLLEQETFSLRTAATVCMNKCNMSDFLRQGRGQSHKKCPELCTSFVNNIIKVNNSSAYNIPVATSKASFKSLQGIPEDVCKKLVTDAAKSGMSFPMLCGGHCKYFGNDTLIVTNLENTKEYTVDDFCNNVEKDRDYIYVLSDSSHAQDVSSLSEKDRVVELRNARTKPASDYLAEKARQEKEKAQREYEKRIAPMKNQYSDDVEKNGFCGENILRLRGDCRRQARKLAQQCRCKVKGYTSQTTFHYETGIGSLTGCWMGNPGYRNGDYTDYEYTPYEYTPTFEDCKATFNETTCGSSMTDLWDSSYDCQQFYID